MGIEDEASAPSEGGSREVDMGDRLVAAACAEGRPDVAAWHSS